MTPSENEHMTPSMIKPGMKFNHWEVIKFDHTNGHRIKYFLCRCDVCGKVKAVRGSSLISGESKACSKRCADNIIGQRFGRWTVLAWDKRDYEAAGLKAPDSVVFYRNTRLHLSHPSHPYTAPAAWRESDR